MAFGKAFVGALDGDFWPPPRLFLLDLGSKFHAEHPIDESKLRDGCRVFYLHASNSDY